MNFYSNAANPYDPLLSTDLYEDVESVTVMNRPKTVADTVRGNTIRAVVLRETLMIIIERWN